MPKRKTLEEQRTIYESCRSNGCFEKRYYLSSLPAKTDVFSHAVRQHWSVENQLHWVLDVTFNEDRQRMNTKHAAQNLAVIRQNALNLLRMDQSPKKMSIKRKQFTVVSIVGKNMDVVIDAYSGETDR